jgi:hypothetical protein
VYKRKGKLRIIASEDCVFDQEEKKNFYKSFQVLLFISFSLIMKTNNHISVDYLSHEWTTVDLITTHKEIKKQITKTRYDLIQASQPLKIKKLWIESHRQARYQNILWRQMANKTLNQHQPLVDPSTLNWYNKQYFYSL